MVSIHPCRHANTMKMMLDWMKSSQTEDDATASSAAERGSIRVDQYLLVFLKFISSVVPTIDYDHTMSISKQ